MTDETAGRLRPAIPAARARVVRVIGLAAMCGVLASAVSAAPAPHAKPAAHQPQSGAAAVADRLWSKLFAKCGASWFYAGSAFDAGGMLSDASDTNSPVMEYRGVQFALVPVRLSEADELNGIEARARITAISRSFRESGGQWLLGPSSRPRNTQDIVDRALSSTMGDLFTFGAGGSFALDLFRYKGGWVVVRTNTDFDDGIGTDSHIYDVEKLMAAPFPRYDCAKGAVVRGTAARAKVASSDDDDQ